MQQLIVEFLAMNFLELTAVVLAIAYLLLAVRENLWCWGAAFVSTVIYLYLFFAARLYMESVLQVFYLFMAVYGWQQWRRGENDERHLDVSTWPLSVHLRAVACIIALSVASGWMLASYTQAAFPYLDSFTSWGAVWTTYLVTRKKLENWLYWIVIDSVGIYLYELRGLQLTAALFALYVVISIFGYVSWLRVSKQNLDSPA
ncbi:MAG: nicotinamide riboside transporter PnuC [Gammaproteobacteria bacterium]|nr:nicotinamide riboside transporter PnuC [Gammaproteobacteria bacterium]